MRSRSWWTVAVAALLAGCADASPAAPESPPPAAHSGGGVVGLVVDDEQVPVPGADVWLAVDEAFRALTGPDGRFAIRDAPLGEQTVRAASKGFLPAEQRVVVTVERNANVTLRLTPIPAPIARTQLYEAQAIIEMGVNVLGIYYYSNQSGSQYRDIFYDVAPDVKSAVTAVRWTAVSPVSAKWMLLGLYLSDRQCVRVCDLVNSTQGRSPLVARGDGLDSRIADRGGPLTVNPYLAIQPACTVATAPSCSSNPDAVAQVAQDQRFQVYTGIFFVEPAPTAYSPAPA